MFVAQPGERNALERVQRHAGAHYAHIVGVVGITGKRGHRPEERQHRRHEHHAHRTDHDEHRGVCAAHIGAFLVDEAEEGGFHAEREQHEQQRRVGVHVRYHAVAARRGRQLGRIERHEQVVEESSHYAAHPVKGRVAEKGFQVCHCLLTYHFINRKTCNIRLLPLSYRPRRL